MLQRLKNFIDQHRIFSPKENILVGVSGGVDSITLLHLLCEAGYQVGVAHCNFSLRGNESDGDETFVRELCHKNNLPFFTRRFNTEEYAEAQDVSIQMSARALRYEWFEQLMSENGYDKVAVAHNLNDNVETFFINLTRGTGLSGLTGMAPLQNRVARPLLFATRDEIMEYSAQHNLTYREDSSNASTKYARNYIRHRIMPEFTNVNPSFLRSMQNNIERLTETQLVIEDFASELKKRCCAIESNVLHISIAVLPAVQQGFWLYELLREYNFSGAVVNDIAQSLSKTSGKKFYSPTHTLIKDRDTLIVSLNVGAAHFTPTDIPQEDIKNGTQISLPNGSALQLSIVGQEHVNFSLGMSVAFFSYDKLQFPLTLRRWQAGDSFVPFGMTGEKKLSDFFIDAKLNLLEKEQQLVLCAANGDIIWVVNQRPDNRYRITSSTKNILKVEII